MTQASLQHQFPQLCFARPWRLLRPAPFADAQAGIDFETALLPRVGRGETGPLLFFARLPHCLVVTRRESRMEYFARARAQLECEGLPLAVRASGGSCVPQGPGMLNLSLVFPRLKDWSLEDGYELICALFTRLLTSYGLSAATGEVPGSFCNGRYNLQVGGRKLLGTAQRWAGGSRREAAILVHGGLLVDLDLDKATAAANRFYQLCGQQQRFDPAACTTLRRCLGQNGALPPGDFFDAVEERLCRQLTEMFEIG